MKSIFILLLTIVILSIMLIAIIGFWFIRLYQKRLKLDEYALHLEQDPFKAREIVVTLVSNALTEWVLYNVRSEEEAYISDSRRDECLIYIINKIVKETSPALLEQIAIGYPVDTREKYIEIIKNIAIIHVIEFCISQNTSVIEGAKEKSMQSINIES